jgi:hypothetical protein
MEVAARAVFEREDLPEVDSVPSAIQDILLDLLVTHGTGEDGLPAPKFWRALRAALGEAEHEDYLADIADFLGDPAYVVELLRELGVRPAESVTDDELLEALECELASDAEMSEARANAGGEPDVDGDAASESIESEAKESSESDAKESSESEAKESSESEAKESSESEADESGESEGENAVPDAEMGEAGASEGENEVPVEAAVTREQGENAAPDAEMGEAGASEGENEVPVEAAVTREQGEAAPGTEPEAASKPARGAMKHTVQPRPS